MEVRTGTTCGGQSGGGGPGVLKTFFSPLGDHCMMSPLCDTSRSYSFGTPSHFFMVIRLQEKVGLESKGRNEKQSTQCHLAHEEGRHTDLRAWLSYKNTNKPKMTSYTQGQLPLVGREKGQKGPCFTRDKKWANSLRYP